MRFQHLLLFLGLFVLSTSAHITGIIPTLKKYHATSSSKYPLTFATTSGLDTYYDFSVVTGVSPASESHPNGIGAFAENFDLMASGHGTTGHGNFTLQVKLPSDLFASGSGSYVLTAAVTRGIGASVGTDVEFFTTSFTVTV
ncbi:unnamed protein product [Umbelopsis vinacea]